MDEAPAAKPPRTRSVRRRIAILLLIPLASLLGLWGFAASVTLGAALNKYEVNTTYNKVGLPGSDLSTQLAIERSASAVFVATGGRDGLAELTAARAKTNASRAVFAKESTSGDVQDTLGSQIQQQLNNFDTQLDRLQSIRQEVDSAGQPGSQADLLRTISTYGDMIGADYELFQSLSIINDLDIYKQGTALITIGWGREFMLREDTLITAVQSSRDPRLTAPEHAAFTGWVAAGRQAVTVSMNQLSGPVKEPFSNLINSPGFGDLRNVEDAIVSSKPGTRMPAAADGWQTVSGRLLGQWGLSTEQAGKAVADRAGPIGDRIILQLVIAGGVGLVAVIASIALSIIFVRRLSQELRGIQQAARTLAEQRLPSVVARLRRGENVDVAAESPPIVTGRTTEINRVAEAFNRVQHTAVDVAVGEAYLRKGISRVFLNLAWRSQSLLHRQLRMLDSMERRATGPEQLDDLFRLDHLTTRMRRHAEGLVILSGAPPSRGWNQPVLLIDVLRGAVAEVEDYTRVDVVTSTTASLTGSAVADVIHLLAELIENATAFSPPPTEVLVRGETVANGFAVEVIDRGIGLSPEEMAELNLRLSKPPEFDLADSDRLGLFVVSRLAVRHGIQVTLQPSAYGGTTAVALIPHDLVVPPEELEEGLGRREVPVVLATEDRPRAWFEPRQISPGGRRQSAESSDRAPAADPVRLAPVSWESAETPEEDPVRRPAEPDTAPFEPVAPRMEGHFSGSWEASVADDSEETGQLPRRVRQANLVPELRSTKGTPSAPPMPAPVPEEPLEDRAVEARDLMSSLQSGWQLGREDDDEPGDGIPPERRNEWGDM